MIKNFQLKALLIYLGYIYLIHLKKKEKKKKNQKKIIIIAIIKYLKKVINCNYAKKATTALIKPNEKCENPFTKGLKPISRPILINNNNNEKKTKKENKKREEKKKKEDKKIKEEIKTKINKFNENKIQEKKPIFKPITEQNMNMENRNRTFTVYTPNQNAFENNPFMKKYILIFLFI